MENMPLTFADLANAIIYLEGRVNAQLELIGTLKDDYAELIANQRRMNELLEEIRRDRDSGDEWKKGYDE